MTEGNTHLTLHNESVEKIVRILHRESDRTGNPTPSTIANTIDAQRSTRSQEAITLTGLPGAGKSYVAEKFGTVYDAPVISMGDAIRAHCPDEARDDSDALADFAADVRRHDPTQIPKWVADLARDEPSGLVIIDGVRSVMDYEVLDDYFKRLHLIEVGASFEVRLERVRDRGREGEDEFGRVELAERDEHELSELGQRQLGKDVGADLTVANDHGEGLLRMNLSVLVDNDLPYDVVDAEPILPPVGAEP